MEDVTQKEEKNPACSERIIRQRAVYPEFSGAYFSVLVAGGDFMREH